MAALDGSGNQRIGYKDAARWIVEGARYVLRGSTRKGLDMSRVYIE